jgi:CRISPR system Cascade subunit CasB
MKTRVKQAGNFVRHRITALGNSGYDSAVKATLAHLRRGVGKHPASNPVTWEVTFYNLPEDLHGKGTEPSYGELAVHTALTLFATHQQGKDLHTHLMHKEDDSIGKAMGSLAKAKGKDGYESVKKRFDKLVTADSLDELSNHLRGVVHLLRGEGIAMDYGKLAEQLYRFQFIDNRNSIRLSWARDFYSTVSDRSHSKEDEDKKG